MLLPAGVLGAIIVALCLKSCGPAHPPNLTEAYTGSAADEIAAANRAANTAQVVTRAAAPVQHNARYGAAATAFYSRREETAAKPAAPAREETDPKTARQSWSFGLTRDAISNTVAKSLNTPKVVAAILNNDYVVKGFMSRATVKAATADKTALADYLKDPVNYEKFARKPAVQLGLDNPEVVDALASSKLIYALLNTPAAVELMNDPQAITAILAANPALGSALADSRIVYALAQNPRTAGILSVR
jgi:hypothetical protein